jgi:hypothetical protein
VNPMQINSPIIPATQPDAKQGYFQPGRERLICPFDSGVVTQVVGSGDFTLKCPQCGRQFRADGSVLGSVPNQPALIMPVTDKADANRT